MSLMNKKKDNVLIDIQEKLINQMNRLDNDLLMLENGKEEIMRSNALTQSAIAFVKTVNVGIRIIETAEKTKASKDKLMEELIYNEK